MTTTTKPRTGGMAASAGDALPVSHGVHWSGISTGFTAVPLAAAPSAWLIWLSNCR
jgi:hypothetical protein